MHLRASTVAHWTAVFRAEARGLRFERVVPWDDDGNFYCEFDITDRGRLCRDIVIDGDRVHTKEDSDV